MKVVFHGDDLGMATSVNAGILQAYERGLLRSTSMMTTAPGWEEAVELARATPGLDVGIHLTLVEEGPALPRERVRSLLQEDGRFYQTHAMVGLRYLQGRWRPEEARNELAAQLDRFMATGLVPTHLDGHLNLHLLPEVFGWVVAEARRRGIRFVRSTIADPPSASGGLRTVMLVALKGVGWLASRRVEPADLVSLIPYATVGFLHPGGQLTTPRLLAVLDRLQQRRPAGIVEVMLHPGRDDPEWIDRSGYRRSQDTALLCDPSLPDALARRGIEVTSFRDLGVAARR